MENELHIIPAAGRHAIQQVLFQVEFLTLLSEDSARKLLNHYDQTPLLSQFLPDKQESRVLRIQFGPGKPDHLSSSDVENSGVLGGIVFQRWDVSRTVLEWQVGFDLGPDTAKLTVVCGVYSRWADVSQKAHELITECLEAIGLGQAIGIQSIALQYVDGFQIFGDLKKFNPSVIFNNAGGFVPNTIYERHGSWHTHSGWFDEDARLAELENTLVNLNLDSVSHADRQTVQITHFQKTKLKIPVFSVNDYKNLSDRIFEQLHKHNKAMLGDLLLPNIQVLICLEGGRL